MDIFFCSEETARLTFLKEGDAKRIMKSFTQEYPISVVASTQRIVHSPKKHTFGSVIYSAKEDCYYEEEPYRNIEVVDRIGSEMRMYRGRYTDFLRMILTVRKHWSMGMRQEQ